MGLIDGELDGLFVGLIDGELDGLLVGLIDGELDGLLVGLINGELDGELDGLLVGLIDGELDGLLVGLFVGFLEVLIVGFIDGESVDSLSNIANCEASLIVGDVVLRFVFNNVDAWLTSEILPVAIKIATINAPTNTHKVSNMMNTRVGWLRIRFFRLL